MSSSSEFANDLEADRDHRRAFFRKTLAGTAAGALVLAGSSPVQAQSSKAAATPNASTIPFSAYFFPFPKLLRSIQDHENDHVEFLVEALGEAARPKPTFKGLKQSSYPKFLRLAQTFENTGVGAYLGAAPVILSRDYLAAAGSIATIESRHAGAINIGLSDPVSQDDESFETPLTASEVAAGVSPFIKSLNGGQPVSYDATPSASNDIKILNFALALEYLEAEFYNLNTAFYENF